MGRDLVNLSHFFLPGDTRTTPGKHLDNTWEIECFFAWIHLVSWKLNVFLRFAPFRIAYKASVPKFECLSTLEIECFYADQGETRFETR